MTVRNPNLDEEIIAYDRLQTSAINDNDEEIKTEISTIKQSILTILYKLNLISDWVIESGSNDNGTWEKWNSGKLVQWGKCASRPVMKDNVQAIPLPFISDATTYIFLTVNRAGGYNGLFAQVKGLGSDKSSFDYHVTSPNSGITSAPDYYAIGRWK